MPRYLLTQSAKTDLAAIKVYLRERSLDASEQMAVRFAQAFIKLSEFPEIGHTRPDLTDRPLRFWTVRPYLIAYRPRTNPVQIIRVLHSAQDLPRMFGHHE